MDKLDQSNKVLSDKEKFALMKQRRNKKKQVRNSEHIEQ